MHFDKVPAMKAADVVIK